MGSLNNLNDLFHHQLKDVYSAEKQLIKALPEMKEKASNNELKNAFDKHIDETEQHKERLDVIAGTLNIDLSGKTCQAMNGLIKEGKSFIDENAEGDVRDAGIIAEAQRIEHYEISAYGTLIAYANALNIIQIAEQLKITLDEESSADKLLSNLAINNINRQANEAVE